MTERFPPTRSAALARLEAFAPSAGKTYAARRNFDLGPEAHDGVSQLSPYLRCRLLTEPQVIGKVLDHHSPQAAEKFIQEVYWRTYWKGWLEMRPGVWKQYLADLQRQWDAAQTQDGLRARWEAACTGQTDIDFFNFWSQELVSTGYLHNHARMWFASIWIFTLRLPWVLGADFFLRHLLDGDPASNTLGWRWVAGLQTPGKTYLARASNIAKFTDGRFHPKWQLASEAPALDGAPAPLPGPVPEDGRPDAALRTGFLLHEEDLSPEFALTGITPVATAALAPQTHIGPLQPAPHVAAFRAAAMSDTIENHATRLGTVSQVADAQAMAEWAREHGVAQIVTAYAPVGPVAAVLDRLSRLDGAPKVVRRLRSYDAQAWPHATKGFFPFKKHIPEFLLSLSENRLE